MYSVLLRQRKTVALQLHYRVVSGDSVTIRIFPYGNLPVSLESQPDTVSFGVNGASFHSLKDDAASKPTSYTFYVNLQVVKIKVNGLRMQRERNIFSIAINESECRHFVVEFKFVLNVVCCKLRSIAKYQ